MGANSYDKDVVLWAQEQAALLRSGQFSKLDVEHIADEIEDVGKAEKRELASRMAVLMAHLLKWQAQPDRRSRSWQSTINEQRKRIALALDETPSLQTTLIEPKWRAAVWSDARVMAMTDTGLSGEAFPNEWPWSTDQALAEGWLPDVD
jgi:Domain of unknown function DUF29